MYQRSVCLYVVTLVSFACHVWAVSLSLKLRSLDLSDLAKLARLYDQADKAAKAGLSLEVSLVCTVRVSLALHVASDANRALPIDLAALACRIASDTASRYARRKAVGTSYNTSTGSANDGHVYTGWSCVLS